MHNADQLSSDIKKLSADGCIGLMIKNKKLIALEV